MSPSEEAQIRHVYERWHDTLMARDVAEHMALYAEHAVFESPSVLAQFPERNDGILRGKAEIETLVRRNLANLAASFSDLYRSDLFFSNGRLLTWEYPRTTPHGSQVDLFESIDIEDGLIVYHRVYWGWQGLKALLAVRERQRT